MHKTVYVEKDEEITSIVGKIRNESSRDIFLVVPKGALLSQGMINLKLLKKEADKLEKELFIVTSDEQAKKIIAKVGLKIKENEASAETKKSFSPDFLVEKASEESLGVLEKNNREREIGSGSFFESPNLSGPENLSEKEGDFPSKELRSEDLKKDLYSKNRPTTDETTTDFEDFQRKKETESILFEKKPPLPEGLRERRVFAPGFSPDERAPRHLKVRQDNDGTVPMGRKFKKEFSPDQASSQPPNFRQAEEFFSGVQSDLPPAGKSFIPNKWDQEGSSTNRLKEQEEGGSSGAKWFLLLLSVLFLVSLAGWGYWNWPKVKIKIFPRGERVEGSIDFKIFSEEGYALGDNEIKGSFHELEVEKTLEIDSTGVGSGSSVGKAGGKVVILNKYSSASQSLVATTRLLSKEGKLFRLTKDTLVPGMEGGNPGKVEAAVIADRPGEEYNIGPSQFTIEGFKGSPKYEKFEVSSNESMKGGGSGDGSAEKKIVLQKDLDAARIKVMDEIGKDLPNLIGEKIPSGQKYFIDSAGKEIIEASADRRVNEEGEKFNFTVREKIKLISFSESDLKKEVFEKIIQDSGEGMELKEEKILFSYDKPVIDWEKKTMGLVVSYQGPVFPQLNEEEIKKELLGKNEQAIKEILVKNSRLEKAEMEYLPAWAGRWPALEKNLSVEMVQ